MNVLHFPRQHGKHALIKRAAEHNGKTQVDVISMICNRFTLFCLLLLGNWPCNETHAKETGYNSEKLHAEDYFTIHEVAQNANPKGGGVLDDRKHTDRQ